MEQQKRKTKTSSAVKNRYNSKVYDSIIVRVPKETAEAFKANDRGFFESITPRSPFHNEAGSLFL